MTLFDDAHGNDRLGYRLRVAYARVRSAYEAELEPYGLAVMGYAVLRLIAREPGRSQAQLARATEMTPQAMSEVLAALHAAGRIERRPAPSGGRTLETHLTPAGKRTLRAADRRLDRLDARLLEGLDAAAAVATLDRLGRPPD